MYRIDIYNLDNWVVFRIDSVTEMVLEEVVRELEDKIHENKLPYKLDVVSKIDEAIDTLVKYEIEKGNEIGKRNSSSYYKNKAVWTKFNKKVEKNLQQTDFTQLADVPFSSDEKREYREYRHFLRTLHTKHNNTSIWNAEVPSFEEWKDGHSN